MPGWPNCSVKKYRSLSVPPKCAYFRSMVYSPTNYEIYYTRLIETANGIPRPRPEDFEEKESDEIDYKKLYAQKQKAEKSGTHKLSVTLRRNY